MRTRDFSFGAGVFEGDSTEELRSTLQRWVGQFSADGFTTDVSFTGVQAWAVSHEDAVVHQDLLVERLQQVVSRLTSL